MTTAQAAGWTDPSALGYSALFGGVLIGSIIPIVPTGAVVGAAAAVAVTTGALSLPLVLLLSVLGALLGDFVTFAFAHAGSSVAQRWVTGRQSPERLAAVRAQFERRGAVIVVIGRLMPAGRIPVLLAAGALEYPWRRLVPAAVLGCILWAVAYALLGVLSGGLFDDPVLATTLAALLVLVLAGIGSLVSAWLRRRRARAGAVR
ncbi:DedA family protein [Pseudonocardia adelaidensis]|uniref:VTT domain-containing protein n=1 Tax=Pseudonocardia adelaidensis TaxID=648754 RepID=A0ABP9NG30_9PSEU